MDSGEYTPTTEEVCEIYWQSGYKTTVEQFDRWLAQVKAEAWDACEDRILEKLVGATEITATLANAWPHNPYREETE